MARLSAEAVAAAAYLGGFRSNDIVEAVKVAYAESSWNTNAANSCCKGLWQINLKAHPDMTANVFDPVQNAKYAYSIWSAAGSKWCSSGKPPNGCNPWQGYGNSRYKSVGAKALEGYMALTTDMKNGKTPEQIIGTNPQSISGTGIPNPLDAAGSIVAGFNRAGAWITNPDNLMRIAKVVLGFGVILVGGAALMDKEIGTAVTGVIPAAKIAKNVADTAKGGRPVNYTPPKVPKI